MFQTKVVEQIKTHVLYLINLFFRKLYRLWGNVEKYCRSGQASDYNMAHAQCIPVYKNTLRICSTYCFSTASLIARTPLHVTLYVHCLFYLIHLGTDERNVLRLLATYYGRSVEDHAEVAG